MRLRNVKDKEEIIGNSDQVVKDPYKYKGKWKDIFKNNNPIYVEIGSGRCGFIYEFAKNNPNINFIGIEKFKSILALGLKSHEFTSNIRFISIDAIEVDKIFDHEIDRVYLNFSDPWPKKRHEKRRLTSKDYLDKYNDIFDSDRNIYIKTDNRKLFEYSLISLNKEGYIISDIHLDLHNDEINDNINTEYEEKFIKKGMPIYQAIMIKKK